MQHRILTSAIVTGLALVVLCALMVKAQQPDETDICVLEHLTAKALSGIVVTAGLDNEIERPIPGAVVELRHLGQQMIIAKITTDSNGHFAFHDIAPGAYSLAAKASIPYRPVLFSTAVEIRLSQAKRERQDKEIILALGWHFNGCHGGYAAVRRRSKVRFAR